jgi:steroid delta-isomerase-like uncharacterized protein
MTTDNNKDVAHRFIQAWSAGGLGVVDELAAPNFTVFYSHFPAPVQGAEGFKAILAQTYSSFPDIRITANEVIGEGDQVVVHWTYRGTHQHGEVLGVPPTGKRVEVAGMALYRIRNGKVLEESGLVDNFSLAQQLGAISISGQGSN